MKTEQQKQKMRDANKRWRESNPERVKASAAKWRTENKERFAQMTKEWLENNKERKRQTSKEWIEQNREHYNERAAKYRKEKPEKIKLHGIRARAKKEGIECTITEDDIVLNEICPYLGIPIDNSDRAHTGSIDRIDNSKGYVPGNIIHVSCKANAMKNNASLEELKMLINRLEAIMQQQQRQRLNDSGE